jgi:hypothetical protein
MWFHPMKMNHIPGGMALPILSLTGQPLSKPSWQNPRVICRCEQLNMARRRMTA